MRPFNSPSKDISAEWSSLRAPLAEMLKPYRDDGPGFGNVSIQIGAERCMIDILLIEQASNGDLGQALKFIMAEVIACAESLGMAA
jgi:hypothetical protein